MPTYHDALAFYRIPAAHPGGMTLTKRLLDEETISADMRILDAGCGLGATSIYLASTYGARVTAVDLSREMLRLADKACRQAGANVSLCHASVEALPFPENTFDFIIAESVTAFADHEAALSEYKRVLRPGGIVLTIDMLQIQPLSPVELEELTGFYSIKQLLTETQWLSAFRQSGFCEAKTLLSLSIADYLQQAADEQMVTSPDDFSASSEMAAIMETHLQLTLTHLDNLGYGVFRAQK
ncbi:class I SAM-dependent methyltransferase [Alkalihalobacillus oceani]|uniref:class I SAM-dependent methyltransferase n=1 Tax=Halalkalibacter oceani TaxID=1653776 RepID=UPI00203D7BF6|nr:class I SAM-dependent methyltransferase [Halalkalibacter oceani]MCM3760846.1 class I SAM-dependent methyltransferase [Halalkalibacter oceani]